MGRYAWVDGRMTRLCGPEKTKTQARAELKRIQGGQITAPPAASPSATVLSICDEFLARIRGEGQVETLAYCSKFPTAFAAAFGDVRVSDLKPFHLTRHIQEHGDR